MNILQTHTTWDGFVFILTGDRRAGKFRVTMEQKDGSSISSVPIKFEPSARAVFANSIRNGQIPELYLAVEIPVPEPAPTADRPSGWGRFG